jgi:hypothetical protein
MSLESRFRHIVAAFGQPVSTAGDGTIFRPPAPIDLHACLGGAVTRRLAAERIEPLVDFGVRTPRSDGAAALSMLWIGDRGGLVCVEMPERGPVAVAALLPAAEPALVSSFLLRFMGPNGRSFGVDFLPALPLWIRNRRPDLLDRWAMKRALWAWMTRAKRCRITSWPEVRCHVADRWGRDEFAETLSHEDRRKLLGMYVAASYVEVAPTRRDAVNADSE